MLGRVSDGLEALETALDAERRELMRANERRLKTYLDAARDWAASWPEVARIVRTMPLPEAHGFVTRRAEGVLPFTVS